MRAWYSLRHDDNVNAEEKHACNGNGNQDGTSLADQRVGDECDTTDRQTPKDDPVDCISHKLIFSKTAVFFQ